MAKETICPECNTAISVSDWPFCPHGEVRDVAIHGDEIDYVDHNLGPRPIRIRSKAERRRLMAERGLREAVRHVPHPAGPDQNHTVDHSLCADDYTVRYKRELLERAFKQKSAPPDDDGPLMVRDVHEMTKEEVDVYRHSDGFRANARPGD